MPREGHDYRWKNLPCSLSNFNPRAPRGARHKSAAANCRYCEISIHVPREGHDNIFLPICKYVTISIHVPREGHDGERHYLGVYEFDISIHVPREGHDRVRLCTG